METTKNSNIIAWTTMLRIALGFYIYGATVLEVFVYYPAWIHIKEDWIAFKMLVDLLIIPLYVVPCFLIFIPNIMMFWYRPASISRALVWWSLILIIIPTISTLAIQLPIQFRMEKGFNIDDYNWLRTSDLYFRQIAAFAGFLVNGYMLLLALLPREDKS